MCAVVVSGEGRAFCAGLDLSNFAEDKEPMDLMPRTHGLANVPQQVAWGGEPCPCPSSRLPMASHWGRPQHHVRRGYSHYPPGDALCRDGDALGLVPDMAGYPLWRGNVRDDVLRKLVYTNAEFSGLEACELGFATETAEDPLERATALAEEIAGKNPEAIRAAKRLSNALAHSTDEDLLLTESEEQTQIIGKANQMEAVVSFMEGRAPKFS